MRAHPLKANVTGSQSQKWKVDKIKSLLVRAKGTESRYIIRGLQGKLRIGLAQSTVLASLAHAALLTRPAGVAHTSEGRLEEIRNMDGTDGKCGSAAAVGLSRLLVICYVIHFCSFPAPRCAYSDSRPCLFSLSLLPPSISTK